MKTREVADFFGSKKKLADALGIQPSAVTMWGENVPQSRQYQIQVLSKGHFQVDPKCS
ncbi:Cro/CI family transcriptional regulator [Pseudomonas sp. UM16]|uniref:Cro/CI family transcriptional regulator n=1 Tax=Pseudomonas sp. UM16 TaxID=3158962 RepID=UPI00398F956F